MTWVKICGITNLEDALVAVEAGADAVGFVFYEKSPRKVDVETVRAIVAELPERVEKVGVFVEQSAEEIREVVEQAELSAVQVHGPLESESVRLVWEKSRDIALKRRIHAIPSGELLEGLIVSKGITDSGHALLVDSGNLGLLGGTGAPFDWRKAQPAFNVVGKMMPAIVAGGLSPSNVVEAISVLQPWGVDVSSGVEARPGKKDPEKVRAFVRAVREADQKAS